MANSISMADLLAKQESKPLSVSRGQEVEGTVVTIFDNEVILDLGTKSEGVLQKKDILPDQLENLKVGDKLSTFVLLTENESGQVVLGFQKALSKGRGGASQFNWEKFQQAQRRNSTLRGKGLEINKGGLIVEVDGVRGFLPSSQVTLTQAANLEEMIGKDLDVTVIEVDPNQNRLIFSQKTSVSEDVKAKLNKLKVGDKVEGQVAAVLPFGVFISLPDGVEGLVHISEISWDKVEDPNTVYKVGDKVEAQVISVDEATGRANLSVKQLSQDPFLEKVKDLNKDDVVKATVTKITSQGIFLSLEGGIEGVIPTSKTEADTDYPIGKTMNCLIDSIDTQKRRVTLAPFITSTKDLIYK